MSEEILTLTPKEYEIYVKEQLRDSGIRLSNFQVKHLEKLTGNDGSYIIDVTARFEAMGVNFLVLIECKHEKNPIKREDVQILHSKLQSLGAQKGIIFSITPFQSGALEYAGVHGIALVQMVDGKAVSLRKGYGASSFSEDIPKCAGLVISLDKDGKQHMETLFPGRGPEVIMNKFNPGN